ncbi:MAG: tryptophan 2,3-dioxygenase family protein, partial [Pseudonocardiaceae bacterium]
MQRSQGGIALTDVERDELGSFYDESVVNKFSEDFEIVWLLTRSFSRGESIPEYYRYTSLHVCDWFLERYRDDPVCASVIAMRATLVDLVAHERAEASRHDTTPGYIEERLARLEILLDRIDTMVLDPTGTMRGHDLAERDAVLRWQLFLLVQCTGFPQSNDHNEHVFLRSVHACELVFYLVRLIACRATLAVNFREPDAVFWLDQLATCAALLTGIFHVLKTLSPQQFMNFREVTGAASAVQSVNFHLMEIAVYGYDLRKTEVFTRFSHLRELNDPQFRHHGSLREVVLGASDPKLTIAFAKVERILLTWRGRHYGFGRLYLPGGIKGSG